MIRKYCLESKRGYGYLQCWEGCFLPNRLLVVAFPKLDHTHRLFSLTPPFILRLQTFWILLSVMATTLSNGRGIVNELSFFLQMISHQWKLLLLPSAIAYLCLVSSLRYKRMKDMHRRFPYHTRESLSRMTVDEAFAIHNYLVKLEFPTVFNAATSFALFKVHCNLFFGRVFPVNWTLSD